MTFPAEVRYFCLLSGFYISIVHYDRMSQLRTMALSICVKWSMTCIVTIIGASLDVAEFSFIDYRDENGHSIVDLNNMWLLKPLMRNTTWFLASLIITKYYFNTKSFTLWDRRKAQQVCEIRRLPRFRRVFRWRRSEPNRVFLQTNGM